MRTVDEILTVVAALSAPDLTRLHSEIGRLHRSANAIVLNENGEISFRLYRQNDSEHLDSLRHSLAIEEDYRFCMQQHIAIKRGEDLNFAQVYLTLKAIADESSRFIDDYKMAFSFPFALDVIKAKRTFGYLLDVRNIKDSLYFSLRKVVDRNDKRLPDGLVHSPFEDEFGRKQIRFFSEYLFGYLIGRWESLRPDELQPFVRRIPAVLIVFGCCKGRVFEEHFESEEEYAAAWKRIREEVARETSRSG